MPNPVLLNAPLNLNKNLITTYAASTLNVIKLVLFKDNVKLQHLFRRFLLTKSFKDLPVNISSFNEIILDNYIYVDKTDLLYELIKDKAKNFFLSRPRRFGKSLILDTLSEIFKGERNLFEGLKIGKTDYNFKKFPVLRLNMALPSTSPEKLEQSIMNTLHFIAVEHLESDLKATDYGTALKELIKNVHDKYNTEVVVLIDEYDDAVSSNIDNMPLAKENSKILRSFYASMKDSTHLLRFAFVTGVTRYAMMGISAGLNNLKDISLNKKYANICGFSLEEMNLYFGDRYPSVLQSLKEANYLSERTGRKYLSTELDLKDEILHWYDGYSWDGLSKVLNPISVLNFFDGKEFKKYWKLTYPSDEFLSNIFNNEPLEVTFDRLENVPESNIMHITPGNIKPVPILFQTGYLTVNKISYRDNENQYSFKVPNLELTGEFYGELSKILCKYLLKNEEMDQKAVELMVAIGNRDGEALTKIIASLYAGLPAVLHMRGDMELDVELRRELKESFYHSMLWAYCVGLVASSRAEEPGADGTPDLTLVLKDSTYVILELKYATDTGQINVQDILDKKAKEALKAIKDKKYGEHYRLRGEKFVTVGVGVFGRGETKVIFGDTNCFHPKK
jgi:hypothetical protein